MSREGSWKSTVCTQQRQAHWTSVYMIQSLGVLGGWQTVEVAEARVWGPADRKRVGDDPGRADGARASQGPQIQC